MLWSFLAKRGRREIARAPVRVCEERLPEGGRHGDGRQRRQREREALRLIVAGDYHQASNRLDEVFFVAPKESRAVVLRRQAALLGPVIPSTATIALKAAADLAPDDRPSRWTLGLAAGTARQARRSDGVDSSNCWSLELLAKRNSDAALTQIALARIAGKQGNEELDATRLREAAGLYCKEGEKAETDADEARRAGRCNPVVSRRSCQGLRDGWEGVPVRGRPVHEDRRRRRRRIRPHRPGRHVRLDASLDRRGGSPCRSGQLDLYTAAGR